MIVVLSGSFGGMKQPALAENPPTRILVLGDSLVAGHGLPQGKAFPDMLQQALLTEGVEASVINAGVSGDTTAGGLVRLDWSLADNPDAAIIVLGGNDLLRGLEPDASYRNLAAIIDRFKAENIAVLLAGMQAPRNFGDDYVSAFDQIYTRLAMDGDIVFYPFFLDGVAMVPDLNLGDGMHPNETGILEITRRIMPSVLTLLAKVPSAVN
jgi:acyl-CoA thioesterase-1